MLKAFKEKTMKRYLYISLLAIAFTASPVKLLQAQNSLVKDSVTMGAAYANEIYYSMANGIVASGPRNLWDISFRTTPRSSSIMINEGSGVMLYTYPKSDTNGWATLDTAGIKRWKPMYNSFDDWENGAFSRNAKGHPDYGWAIYNIQTHDLVADSLFVIKLRDGSFRKLWIVRKYSSTNKYSFRFAKINGSEDTKVMFDCTPYTAKNFVGYSIQTAAVVDFEPAKASWDLLFTKYESIQPDGTPYPVTGVISNDGVKTITYHNADPNLTTWDISLASVSRSAIGWNWKTFDGTYVVEPNLVYFLQDKAGKMNKLMFTKFAGSSTGLIVFKKAVMLPTAISENTVSNEMSVYPNPVKDKLNISMDNTTSFPLRITLSALTGQLVYAVTINENPGNTVIIPVNDMPNGMYLLTARSAAGISAKKVVVNK